MKVQFVTDDKGQQSGVFLTMKQYKKLMADLEELDEIRAYDRAKKQKKSSRSFSDFVQELNTMSQS